MSGKKGQSSAKGVEVPDRYRQDFLDSMDGRTNVARSLRDRFSALTRDLGGETNLSYQERSLCKRALHLERLLELKEATLAQGGSCDEGSYLNGLNVLSGLFSKLGLRRRTKPVIDVAKHFQETRNDMNRNDATPDTTP